MYRTTIKLLKYAYVSSYVGYTYIILFTNPIINIQEKKTSNMHTSFSYHIHIHRDFWLCEYVHYPNANNPERLKEITNTLIKIKPDFYLLGGDFVDESTSKEDMEILFKQLGKLTKVAPVYFVYGNHENKIKFTRTKLKQVITKNNITILNDQEVHLNNIILIGRKDYTNKNRKKTKDYNIVLDHQSQGTRENIKNHVNLQLSGHTHNGQMFPLSFSYHLQPDFAGNYGKETFKHHTKIISSGLVGWGFPIRTEGICEYVVVNVTPDN